MASICTNPYCSDPAGGMHSPTAEEVSRFRNDLDKRFLDKFGKKEISFQICTIPPGNIYYVVFKGDSKGYGYSERTSLVPELKSKRFWLSNNLLRTSIISDIALS